jgi:hypothetical protein
MCVLCVCCVCVVCVRVELKLQSIHYRYRQAKKTEIQKNLLQ